MFLGNKLTKLQICSILRNETVKKLIFKSDYRVITLLFKHYIYIFVCIVLLTAPQTQNQSMNCYIATNIKPCDFGRQ